MFLHSFITPEYNLETQARIPAALCVLHNFILTHDAINVQMDEDDSDGDEALAADINDDEPVVIQQGTNVWRDHIAQEMWDEYQGVLADRKLENLDLDGQYNLGKSNFDHDASDLGGSGLGSSDVDLSQFPHGCNTKIKSYSGTRNTDLEMGT